MGSEPLAASELASGVGLSPAVLEFGAVFSEGGREGGSVRVREKTCVSTFFPSFS